MAESAGKVLEGVFAVKKPQSLSSAQVLRDLQHAFAKSKTFQPLLQETHAKDKMNQHRSKRRKIDNDNIFRMGHGGTLDPLATGVLIVGIGRGTKFLPNFLECTKTYETVVLFGKSTDTYDIAGKITASADASHIDRKLVEEKMAAFRGKIKQVPPIYSALKIDGVKAYDYARSGRPLPRELPARDMEVTECTLLEWFDAGKHDFRWPLTEATTEEKAVFTKLVHGETSQPASTEPSTTTQEPPTDPSPPSPRAPSPPLSPSEKAAKHTHTLTDLSPTPAPTPAARIRLTVSSGFYVRSFAHDLGIACSSYATMAELARTRQGEFTTADPAGDLVPTIDHAQLEEGEEAWGPTVAGVLEKWIERNPAPETSNSRGFEKRFGRGGDRGGWQQKKGGEGDRWRKRRNSSSPEM